LTWQGLTSLPGPLVPSFLFSLVPFSLPFFFLLSPSPLLSFLFLPLLPPPFPPLSLFPLPPLPFFFLPLPLLFLPFSFFPLLS
ncbi:hypothetical protein ACXWRS_11070, partial [Streptococcus pyogenes]